MNDPLALKYRPLTFREMVGQRPVQAVLHYMIHQPKAEGGLPRAEPTVPSALLFHGERGCGKTTAARIVAAALNCEDTLSRPCTGCASCKAVAARTSPGLLEVDAASAGLVEDIRDLTELVSYDSGTPYRVVMLDEAHSMSDAAFNALLKTLEEPPPRTVFILVTTRADKIMKTVASRCMPFQFYRIAPQHITARLAHICEREGFEAEAELLADLADRADGGLRDAIVALEQCVCSELRTVAQYRWLHGESDYAPVLLSVMAQGDQGQVLGQLERTIEQAGDPAKVTGSMVRCLRDILVLHAGGSLAATGATLARREALAAHIPAVRAGKALEVLWELQAHVRGIPPRDGLTLAAAMCSLALHPAQREQHQAGVNGNGTMSAADVAAMAARPLS
jgi:DNA polymerase-3 subunit gamma/tau